MQTKFLLERTTHMTILKFRIRFFILICVLYNWKYFANKRIRTFITLIHSCSWPSWPHLRCISQTIQFFFSEAVCYTWLETSASLNSERRFWSERLECSETLYRQPVTPEHNRIKQPYEKCSVVCTFLNLSLCLIYRFLKNTYAHLCWQRNTHSLTQSDWRFPALVYAHAHTHTAWGLSLWSATELLQSCVRLTGMTNFPVRQVPVPIII